MIKNTGRLVQHVNALLILVVCMYYSSLYNNYIGGLSAWGISLMYLYFYDLCKGPELLEPGTRARIILSSLVGWGLSLCMLGLFIDIQHYHLVFSILFLILLIVSLYYWRYYSQECVNLALVVRANTGYPHEGELRYLEDIEEYIQNYAKLNHVELLDPTYSGENLVITNESEWHSLTEFKNRRSLPQQREKEPQERVFFSCLLSGKMKYLLAVKTHIADFYLREGRIRSLDFTYSRDRLHIVSEREWKAKEEFSGNL
ncbi:MAG: hypothetical protein HXS44_02035 [Theionarchaea archaeon]|nr:hypothetical protein [Theionarchaea archaeon]